VLQRRDVLARTANAATRIRCGTAQIRLSTDAACLSASLMQISSDASRPMREAAYDKTSRYMPQILRLGAVEIGVYAIGDLAHAGSALTRISFMHARPLGQGVGGVAGCAGVPVHAASQYRR
jgi:hypothetical protein